MHDPMLGFPTPPQSSPHFASSPLIPTVVSTIFQPHPMTPITPGQESFSHEDVKELVGETNVQTPLPSSPNGGSSLPPCELHLCMMCVCGSERHCVCMGGCTCRCICMNTSLCIYTVLCVCVFMCAMVVWLFVWVCMCIDIAILYQFPLILYMQFQLEEAPSSCGSFC